MSTICCASCLTSNVSTHPSVGQDGGFCRGQKGWMVMANVVDNRDPGEEQQPRFNLTVSMSSDVNVTQRLFCLLC